MDETRHIKRVRNLLKKALLAQLETTSIHKIYVAQLCKTCQINRASFYAYYEDIYSLLNEIEKDVIQDLSQIINPSDVTLENAAAAANAFITYLYQNRNTVRALLFNGTRLDFATSLNELLFLLLKQSVQQQYIIPDDFPSERFEDILRFVVFGHYSYYIKFLLSDNSLTQENILVTADMCSELSRCCLSHYFQSK